MSLFSALDTSQSGLTAQAAAFSNISDNVANSQTVGFKATDTSFLDYVTSSTAANNDPGAVNTRPDYTNEVQGTISQSSDPLALAISGQGFFAVTQTDGVSANTNQPTFSPQTDYTRTGDFQVNGNGYLVNSAGEYLEGWAVNPQTGAVDQSKLVPIQVSTQSQSVPVPTTQLSLTGNLPGAATVGTTVSSQTQVYDASGAQHTLTLNWTESAANSWSLTAYDGSTQIGTASAPVQFNASTGALTSPGGSPPTLTLTPSAGAPSWVPTSFTMNVGGLSQDATSSFSVSATSQNGAPAGNYSGVSITQTGDVVVNYDNGQTQTIAQAPVMTFANADALQRQDGQAFTATTDSGAAVANNANSGGAGSLVVGSVEGSNVDIATEFSKLITAQEAYSANAKLITTADDLLQVTINMKT